MTEKFDSNEGHIPHSLESITGITEEGNIIHYTCNAPGIEVLKKHKIICRGNMWECKDVREILLIPANLYKNLITGNIRLIKKQLLISLSEQLLRDLK